MAIDGHKSIDHILSKIDYSIKVLHVKRMKNPKIQSSCYCGKSGDTEFNMLQCAKCKRWYHGSCIKCLDVPMLYGDRFFIYVCSLCNAGSEYLGRIELTWSEIVHLVLYHLTLTCKKKYFHLESSIMSFIHDSWNRLHLFGSVTNKDTDRQSTVLEILKKEGNKFKSGKEVKKSKDIFALRVKCPPEAPVAIPIACRIVNNNVVWDFQVKDRNYHILTAKKEIKSAKQKTKLSVSTSKQKNAEVSKCRSSVSQSLPQHENGIQKAKHKVKRTSSVFSEESAQVGLLDSLIPFPPDFSDGNNPFRKKSKATELKRPIKSTSNSEVTLLKRKWNGSSSCNKTVQNGTPPLVDEAYYLSLEMLQPGSSFFTKDFLSHSSQIAKGEFCIIGKRISDSGKVQYLVQKNS